MKYIYHVLDYMAWFWFMEWLILVYIINRIPDRDAWRYGIYLIVFTFDISLVRYAHWFDIDVKSLKDKFRIFARPCIILYFFYGVRNVIAMK